MAYDPLRLAENIVLLQKHRRKPLPPTPNDLIPDAAGEGRVFTLKQELSIVQCLTYLSAYSDEAEQVMALCIEESGDHQSIIVRFATNNGDTDDLRKGIRDIADVLQQQTKSPQKHFLDALLAQIFKNARERIVRRIGLMEGDNRNERLEKSTAVRLKAALNAYAIIQPAARQTHKTLYNLSRDLLRFSRQFDSLSSKTLHASTNTVLMSILTIADELLRDHKNEVLHVLATIPNSGMDPSTKEHLISQLEHLGHYMPTATRLLKFAKRHPILHSIRPRAVYIPPLDLSPYFTKTNQKSIQFKQFKGSITQKTLAVKQRQIQPTVQRHQQRKHYKVHAEIQLLFHYEQATNVAYRPRILKSSKLACFLCDLFLKEHGGLYIPKTHGRVYDRWILPDMAALNMSRRRRNELDGVVQRFNEKIEGLLIEVGTNKMTRVKDDPRESGTFTISPTSTQESLGPDDEGVEDMESSPPPSPLVEPEDEIGPGMEEHPVEPSHSTLPDLFLEVTEQKQNTSSARTESVSDVEMTPLPSPTSEREDVLEADLEALLGRRDSSSASPGVTSDSDTTPLLSPIQEPKDGLGVNLEQDPGDPYRFAPLVKSSQAAIQDTNTFSAGFEPASNPDNTPWLSPTLDPEAKLESEVEGGPLESPQAVPSKSSSSASTKEAESLSSRSKEVNNMKINRDVHPAGTAETPITPATPMTPTCPELDSHNPDDRSEDDEPTPRHPTHSPSLPPRISPEPTTLDLLLERDLPYSHTFHPLDGGAICFCTPKIHLYFSRTQADALASWTSLDLLLQETRTIRVEALWLGRNQASKTIEEGRPMIDLKRGDWDKEELQEYIMFGDVGLLFRNKMEVVRLSASYIAS